MRTGNFANKVLAVVALAATAAGVSAREPLEVYTGHWPPFVGIGDEGGSATDVVRMVFHNMGRDARFERQGFAYSYLAVKKGSVPAAFPYFATRTRREEVLFSQPLFTVRNTVYYNLQYRDFSAGEADPATLRVGRVSGYSYGEGLDAVLATCPVSDAERCPVYGAEADAVRALLADQIDLLPMTDSVAAQILAADFKDEALLLREVPGRRFSGRSTLHLIAPRTPAGQALIDRFNASHAELLAADIIPTADNSLAATGKRGASVVRIASSEGFPIVVGVSASDPDQFFAVPEGTRALVLEWSDKIVSPAVDDRLYAVMVDQSLVVILDGPHVGKELRIRNMHLSIDE